VSKSANTSGFKSVNDVYIFVRFPRVRYLRVVTTVYAINGLASLLRVSRNGWGEGGQEGSIWRVKLADRIDSVSRVATGTG